MNSIFTLLKQTFLFSRQIFHPTWNTFFAGVIMTGFIIVAAWNKDVALEHRVTSSLLNQLWSSKLPFLALLVSCVVGFIRCFFRILIPAWEPFIGRAFYLSTMQWSFGFCLSFGGIMVGTYIFYCRDISMLTAFWNLILWTFPLHLLLSMPPVCIETKNSRIVAICIAITIAIVFLFLWQAIQQ